MSKKLREHQPGQTQHDKRNNTHKHIVSKTEEKEKILKAAEEKRHMTHRRAKIGIMANLSSETLPKARE